MKDPISIVLPQQKMWSWETKTVSSDAVALATHYDRDPTHRGKLWTPDQADSVGWTPMKAPLLLAIPLALFRAIREEGKPLMPHKIHGLTTTIINSSADVAKAHRDWDLVLAWCILAAQQNTYGNSHLSLAVEAVTEGDDDYFEKWINQQTDSTFGPRPGTGLAGYAGMGGVALHHDPAHVSAIMATEVGKGVALGLRAAGHLHRDAAQLGGGYKMETSKEYTKDNIAAIMGLTGVYNGHSLPNIWELFNATKGKNIDTYRHHLYARMKHYTYDRRIQSDTSVYLEQETIKAIDELRFNLGEGVAHLALAKKGLSILACHAHTMQETERVCKQEQALTAMEKTRLLDDLLRLPKGTTQAPADNFWELKMNIAMFMSLVWVLFGS
jgi:hypothetical protein